MGQPEDFGKPPMNVDESERPQTPPPTAPTSRARRLWEKIGVYNLSVLVLGTAVIFLALAFLIFEWIVSRNAVRGGEIPELWRLIIIHRWTTRVMTIASVLIRVATAAQLGVFAAIMAALILEKVGVPRANLPQVSMIRCSNSGPNSLALSLFGSIFTLKVLPYSFLVILAILDALALQFTSTILLGDYRDSQVVLGLTKNDVTLGFPTEGAGSQVEKYHGIDYWNSAPVAYNRFAEYKQEGSESTNYVDTGKTYRGFLPFRNATTRQSLRKYSGPMTVIDARVVCVQPTLSNVSFDAIEDAFDKYPTLRAQYSWKDTHPDIVDGDGFSRPLNCTIPSSDHFPDESYWVIALCGDHDVLSPARLNEGIRPDFDDDSLPVGHTSVHILLNTTGTAESWVALKAANKTLEQVVSSEAPWARLQGDDVTLDVSVCFFNPLPTNYKVDVSSKIDGDDATIDWDPVKGSYNTLNVRRMFGGTKPSLTPEQRGLLQFTPPASWADAQSRNVYDVEIADFLWDTLRRVNRFGDDPGPNDAITTSTMTEKAVNGDSVHRAHVAVFQQIIQETGNPALALQALWTTLLQMAYYDFLPQYSVHTPAAYETTSSISIPTQQRSLAAVLGLIGLHFALVIIAVVMFARTEMSLLGNTWQAISQVMSHDTADMVHRGATATDGEVFDELKTSGVAYEKVRITKCESTGRAQATAVCRQPGGQV